MSPSQIHPVIQLKDLLLYYKPFNHLTITRIRLPADLSGVYKNTEVYSYPLCIMQLHTTPTLNKY